MTIHRGTVTDNVDPIGLGRLRVQVPDVGESPLAWALPVVPLGLDQPRATAIGTPVWVTFENDDVEYPVVLGIIPS